MGANTKNLTFVGLERTVVVLIVFLLWLVWLHVISECFLHPNSEKAQLYIIFSMYALHTHFRIKYSLLLKNSYMKLLQWHMCAPVTFLACSISYLMDECLLISVIREFCNSTAREKTSNNCDIVKRLPPNM